MKKTERIQKILELLWRQRQLTTNEIMETFGLAEATVRRDVNYIAQLHRGISRYHGGLRLDENERDHEHLFDVKLHVEIEAKQIIARRAAKMVNPGDRLFLDSGSTCLVLARELGRKSITIVTTDVKIANELGNHSSVETYIVGGLVRPGFFSVGTALALDFMRNFSVETVFMSCDAVDVDAGITNASVFEVDVKRKLIEKCETVVALLDHGKFDRTELHAVAPLSEIDVIVTDPAVPEDVRQRYRQAGPRLIVA